MKSRGRVNQTPIKQLYLDGAGMHPWAEVNGGPGHNVAHTLLADLASA
jgi:phytoene dehydrogenase-like protein